MHCNYYHSDGNVQLEEQKLKKKKQKVLESPFWNLNRLEHAEFSSKRIAQILMKNDAQILVSAAEIKLKPLFQ